MMTTVLIDTSAFLAFTDRRDIRHKTASGIWNVLIRENTSLVCNNYVLLETLALFQKRLGMAAVRDFQYDIVPLLDVHWLTEQDHTEAMGILLTANRQRLSLVDCTAFVTMRHRGIRQVFTFDPHFAEQGFEVVTQ